MERGRHTLAYWPAEGEGLQSSIWGICRSLECSCPHLLAVPVLVLVKRELHCPTAGCLSAHWFVSLSSSFSATAAALAGGHSPSPFYLKRGGQMMGISQSLDIAGSFSTLGWKSSSLLTFHLRKLWLDSNIVFNAHVSLLGCPSAVIRDYRTFM
jgi:hypothetical protein